MPETEGVEATVAAKAAATSSSQTQRKARNDSPGPKAAATVAPKERAAAAVGARDDKPAAEPRVETEKEIFGMHRQVLLAVFVAPVAVFASVFVGIVVLDLGTVVWVNVLQYWRQVSGPIETFLVNNADSIVVLAALITLSPLLIVMAVSACRAAGDLDKLEVWQKVLLGALVVTALATAITLEKLFNWKQAWDRLTDPLEDILSNKADSIVAGAAIVCLSPLVAILAAYAVRAVWGCRVKITVEPVEEQAAE